MCSPMHCHGFGIENHLHVQWVRQVSRPPRSPRERAVTGRRRRRTPGPEIGSNQRNRVFLETFDKENGSMPSNFVVTLLKKSTVVKNAIPPPSITQTLQRTQGSVFSSRPSLSGMSSRSPDQTAVVAAIPCLVAERIHLIPRAPSTRAGVPFFLKNNILVFAVTPSREVVELQEVVKGATGGCPGMLFGQSRHVFVSM